MRTPFAIQEILGLGVGSAAAVAYPHSAHLQQPVVSPIISSPLTPPPPPPPPPQATGLTLSLPLAMTASTPLTPPPAPHTPNDCNTTSLSPVSSTPGRLRPERSISPDVGRLSAAAAAAAAAAHVQLPVFNPANFYAAAGYAAATSGDPAAQLNAAAHHHHMTTLAAAAYLRGFLPPGFAASPEFRGHFQQHFGAQFVGKFNNNNAL